tara:strand:- start:580 stop:741 length:162 start_codon:yes stop_codon:yes gene_type:complete
MFIEDRIVELHELDFEKQDIARNISNMITWKSLNSEEETNLKQNILEEVKNDD